MSRRDRDPLARSLNAIELIEFTRCVADEVHNGKYPFTVVSGDLAEAVYLPSGDYTGELHEHTQPAGCSVGFDARYVHDVRNLSLAPAVSVHAYSKPLTSMIIYDLADGGLERIATLATDDPEPAFDIWAAS